LYIITSTYISFIHVVQWGAALWGPACQQQPQTSQQIKVPNWQSIKQQQQRYTPTAEESMKAWCVGGLNLQR
jgi:hypothetical protein